MTSLWRILVLLALIMVPISALSRTVVDETNTTIEIPNHIERVAAAGPPASVFLYSLTPDLMLGWSNGWSETTLNGLGDKARSMKVIGSVGGKTGTESNIERLIMYKPDIIVDIGNHLKTNISMVERVRYRTSIPFILYDGSVSALPHAYREVGEVLGRKEDGEIRAKWIEQRLNKIEKVLSDISDAERPRIYYARGVTGLESGSRLSIHAETIEMAGGRNVAGDAGGNRGILQLSMDQVMAFDPDIIVASDDRFLKTIKDQPIWQNLRAIKNGKILVAPSVPFSWVDLPPSVNRVIGVIWLTNKLYPSRYPVDIETEVKEFYSLFYHVELDKTAINGLLHPSDNL